MGWNDQWDSRVGRDKIKSSTFPLCGLCWGVIASDSFSKRPSDSPVSLCIIIKWQSVLQVAHHIALHLCLPYFPLSLPLHPWLTFHKQECFDLYFRLLFLEDLGWDTDYKKIFLNPTSSSIYSTYISLPLKLFEIDFFFYSLSLFSDLPFIPQSSISLPFLYKYSNQDQ